MTNPSPECDHRSTEKGDMTDQAPELLPCPWCGEEPLREALAQAMFEHNENRFIATPTPWNKINDYNRKQWFELADVAIAVLTPALVVAREPVQANTEQVHGQGDHPTKPRPADCPNIMACGWHHVRTEPEIGLWLCGFAHCPHMIKAQAARNTEPLIANQSDLRGSLPETVAREPVGWQCAGRKQSLPEPADCNWPQCGCDSYANKVIGAIEESGFEIKPIDYTSPPPASAVREATIEECAKIAEQLSDDPAWSPHYKNASLAIAGKIRKRALASKGTADELTKTIG